MVNNTRFFLSTKACYSVSFLLINVIYLFFSNPFPYQLKKKESRQDTLSCIIKFKVWSHYKPTQVFVSVVFPWKGIVPSKAFVWRAALQRRPMRGI
jgi:hypothetical protein